MIKVNLNDPWLIAKSQVVGFVLGILALVAGIWLDQDLAGIEEAMGLIVGALFLTLLLPYRIHDQQAESGSLKILGTLPSVVLGLAGSIVIVGMMPGIGQIHCIWLVIWGLSDTLFASFWYMGGMSRVHQIGLNGQIDQLPRALGRILNKLCTGYRTMDRRPVLADQILQAYNADDVEAVVALLDEAHRYLEGHYEHWGKVREQHAEIFAEAKAEVENATQRIIALSRSERGGEGHGTLPKQLRQTAIT